MGVGGYIGVEVVVVVSVGVVVAIAADHGHIVLGHSRRVKDRDDGDVRVGRNGVGDVEMWRDGVEEVVEDDVEDENAEDSIAGELQHSSASIGCVSSMHARKRRWLRCLSWRQCEVHDGCRGRWLLSKNHVWIEKHRRQRRRSQT